MIIYPAIDLYENQAVRLYHGDYAQKTVYSEDPLSVAREFKKQGAAHIHLVDLEGARYGTTPHLPLLCRIKEQTGLFCEVGGGIRSDEVVSAYLSNGIDCVILGTAAVEDPEFLRRSLAKYGEKIAVGVDVKEGFVAVKGWTEQTKETVFDFCERLQNMGVSTIICTDISKDGAMKGTNRSLYRELMSKVSVNIIASGGVSDLSDVEALAASGLYGAIIGKAYYTGSIDLKKAIEVASC